MAGLGTLKLMFQVLLSIIVLQLTSCCLMRFSDGVPKVVQVTSPVIHGEGPHWDVNTQALFFVDIVGRLVNRYVPSTNEVTHAKLEGDVSLVIPVKGSSTRQLLVTCNHDIVLLDWNHKNETFGKGSNSGNVTVLASVENNKTGNRWNDGKADARGNLWAGTIGPEHPVGYVKPDEASLYLLNNQQSISVAFTPVSISNGIAWNKENTLMYYIDTATYQVDVFSFDLKQSRISNHKKVFNLKENNITGLPDGMTIDNRGNLWIACFNGGQVINVDPKTGKLLHRVNIPAKRVTSVIFGGSNLDILYVTTSRFGLTDEELLEQPLAGSVFSITGLGVTAQTYAYKFIHKIY